MSNTPKVNPNTLKTSAKFVPKGQFNPKNVATNLVKTSGKPPKKTI